ncbi:MAG TPA: PAS domain S-box protein [Candidatus Methanomethylophilaceae archaeon]|nr:PAS domain S-box protein [Candidatus Methanomethylophilaceae archaeon]
MKGVLCVDSEGDFQEMKISLRGLNISETALTENSEKILFVRDVDVVMTDYKMPGMGSVEPLRNLCVRGSEIPSMLFTDKGCGGGVDILNSDIDLCLQGNAPQTQFAEMTHIVNATGRRESKKLKGSSETTKRNEKKSLNNEIADTLNGTAKESEKAPERVPNLHDIVENLPDPTMVVDKDGKLIAWNKAMEELTGVPKSEILWRGDNEYSIIFYGYRRPTLVDIILGNSEGAEKYYSNLKRTGDTVVADYVMLTISGKEIWVWAAARPLVNSEGEVIGVIETIRDITERKMMDEALRRANRQLNLLTNVTRHDIMNLTTALGGYLELMRDHDEFRTDEQISRLIDIVERINSQIKYTTFFNNIGASKPQWQNVKEILPPPSEFGGVHFETDVNDVEIFADPLLSKVFYNLLDNSLRHGAGVSRITLRKEEDDNGLRLRWEDDGMGIPAEDKERIFERDIGRNTGLGLFISRDILSITEIRIWEEGEEGQGAKFVIFVPKERYRSAV